MDFAPIAIVPIVIAVVAMLKQIPAVSSRTWLQPLLAILVGLTLTSVALVAWPPESATPLAQLVAVGILQGIVNGLAGAGLYDTGKKLIA